MEKIGSLLFKYVPESGHEQYMKVVDDFIWIILLPYHAKIMYEQLRYHDLCMYILHEDGSESLLEDDPRDIDWYDPALTFGLGVGRISLEICKEDNWHGLETVAIVPEK